MEAGYGALIHASSPLNGLLSLMDLRDQEAVLVLPGAPYMLLPLVVYYCRNKLSKFKQHRVIFLTVR